MENSNLLREKVNNSPQRSLSPVLTNKKNRRQILNDLKLRKKSKTNLLQKFNINEFEIIEQFDYTKSPLEQYEQLEQIEKQHSILAENFTKICPLYSLKGKFDPILKITVDHLESCSKIPDFGKGQPKVCMKRDEGILKCTSCLPNVKYDQKMHHEDYFVGFTKEEQEYSILVLNKLLEFEHFTTKQGKKRVLVNHTKNSYKKNKITEKIAYINKNNDIQNLVNHNTESKNDIEDDIYFDNKEPMKFRDLQEFGNDKLSKTESFKNSTDLWIDYNKSENILDNNLQKSLSIFGDINFDDITLKNSNIKNSVYKNPLKKTKTENKFYSSLEKDEVNLQTDLRNNELSYGLQKKNQFKLLQNTSSNLQKSSIFNDIDFGDLQLQNEGNLKNCAYKNPFTNKNCSLLTPRKCTSDNILDISENIKNITPMVDRSKFATAKTLFSDMKLEDLPQSCKKKKFGFKSPMLNKQGNNSLNQSSFGFQTATKEKTIMHNDNEQIQNKFSLDKVETSIFDDIDCKDLNLSTNSLIENKVFKSPLVNCQVNNSTPVKSKFSTPNKKSSFNLLIRNNYLSPITTKHLINSQPLLNNLNIRENGLIDTKYGVTLHKPSDGDIKKVVKELNQQKLLLEKQIEIINEKQQALNLQIEDNFKGHLKLLSEINQKKEMDLKSLNSEEQLFGEEINVSNVVLQINPQNAEYVHFTGDWGGIATVTADGDCVLVPNFYGQIGFPEVQSAFQVIPGVNKRFIPDGWTKNHYKWIVWKLASYERYFPSTLGGSLTIENVIKQLKYRYTRELYNFERPALRKIYEKDDVPQKRMVLCVSNIVKDNKSTELELTDGWYSIRTTIDNLLCNQVKKRKIKIGTKLIMCGAEILNCEGCHPLEIERASKVRLKICFNSTRQAAWYAKLGYQKYPLPFIIPLDSTRPNGGLIGSMKVLIVRLYPLQYMERIEDLRIWRNKKSETRQAQEYENRQLNSLNLIHYENSSKDVFQNSVKTRDVAQVLKLKVADLYKESQKVYTFIIWKANNFHTENIKENSSYIFYNVAVKTNNELSSIGKTQFKQLETNEQEDRGKFLRRKLVSIDKYEIMTENINFHNEFDTVGFVIEVTVQELEQALWLASSTMRLLLIKINEGPSTCLLFDGLKKGDIVSVSNLLLTESGDQFVQACATLSTVVSRYPQSPHLQKGVEDLQTFKKDELDFLLHRCENIVSSFGFEKMFEKPSTSRSIKREDDELFPCSQNTEKALSMINMDTFQK